MFCPVCGTQNDDSSKFCKACGAVLSVDEAASNQPSLQPQPQPQSQPQEPTSSQKQSSSQVQEATVQQQSFPEAQLETAQQQEPMQQPSPQPEAQQSSYAPQQVRKVNAFGIAGFACSVCALFCIRVPVLDFLLLIAGLVLSGIGATKQPQGFAIVGLVISIFELVAFVLALLAFLGFVTYIGALHLG